MATLTKREGIKGTTFQVRYRIDGNQKTKSFAALDGTKSAEKEAEKNAKKFKKDIEAQLRLGIVKDDKTLTFKEYGKIL